MSKLYSAAVVNVNELYPELEICCLDFYYWDMKCRLFAIYWVPSSNDMPRIVGGLFACSDVKFNWIVVDDFNCPNVDCNTSKAKADGAHDELLNLTVTRGFSQVLRSAIRLDNLLDICLNKRTTSIYDIDVIQTFCKNDHSQVICSLFYKLMRFMMQLLDVMTGPKQTTKGCQTIHLKLI